MVLCWYHVGTVSRALARCVVGIVGAWCLLLQLTGHADPWGGEWTAWATAVLVLVVIEAGRTTARAPAASFAVANVLLVLVETPAIGWSARLRSAHAGTTVA
jgi:hypothetical protein